MAYDVAVIGGGLIGAACADALAGEGLTVCVLERQEFAREASWAGAGILHPIHPSKYPVALHPLLRAAPALHPPCALDLLERTGIDVECERSGLLVMDDHLDSLADWCGPDLPCERVSAVEDEPAILEGGEALLLPNACHVRNHRLARAFLEGARRRGAVLLPFSPVQALRPGAVETPTGTIEAGLTVLCTGAWAPQLRPGLDIEPVRGQILLYGPESGVRLRRMVVFPDGEYAVPRRDGRILFGSTLERVGFDALPTKTACERLSQRAAALLGLSQRHFRAIWAGLRPATGRTLPFIGKDPKRSDLILACGHYRNGILLAPLTARLVVDLAADVDPFLDLSALAVQSD